MLPARTHFVDLQDARVLSSYQPKGSTVGPRASCIPLCKLTEARKVAPDMAVALVALHEAITAAGGDFRVTDGGRSFDMQLEGRLKYEIWLAAGKPARGSTKWASNMKDAFVAMPGESFHNAGRSIDVFLAELEFPVVAPDKQLDKLWELAIPLGWRPIVAAPDENAKEAWHFDFMGEWRPVYDRLGYAAAAMCAALDLGLGEEVFDHASGRALQAQLHRAGYDVGKVDGIIGKNTKRALAVAMLPETITDPAALFGLPSSAVPIWTFRSPL